MVGYLRTVSVSATVLDAICSKQTAFPPSNRNQGARISTLICQEQPRVKSRTQDRFLNNIRQVKPLAWVVLLASPVILLLALAGCGSSGSAGPGNNSTADFSLTASPSTVSLTAGGTGQTISLAAVAAGGFSSPIAVAITGLPAGVTASPSTFSLNAGTSQPVALTASATAVAASSITLTLSGTAGKLSHAATATLAIATPAPDFSLTLAPKALTLEDNAGPQTFTVTANALNSFTGKVAVALTGLPTGVTAAPSSLTLIPGTPQTVSLAATTAALGTSSLMLNATSGSLAHSATLALTIANATAPGFALAVTPAAQTLTIGNATGAQLTVAATALNGFTGQVAVTLSGLPTGVTATPATLTLTPGMAQSVTLVAGYSAAAGSTTVSFNGAAGSVTNTTTLALTLQPYPVADVTTYHYDNTRDGLNAQESILTPATVTATTFGKVGFYTVDGKVDAAPLFAAQVHPAAHAVTNVVYVATEHDSVYAFDTATGLQIWKATVLGANEATAKNGCEQISPEAGITSTPVIDRAAGPNGTIFVIGMSKDSSGAYHQRLHALDLATGAEQSGSPSEITASYPGTGDNSSNGNVLFDPAQYAERVGLLLLNGTIYTAWTSHCDIRPYTGWVMGFSESTLQQTQVLNLTPNGSEGAIWMSGDGLAADTSGNIYLLDANGSFQDTFNAFGFPSDGDYGNGILKLSNNGGILGVSDFFEIYNSDAESADDTDIGSGGLLLIPDQVDANGNTRHLLVGAGKDTNIYVADRDNMGKFNVATPDNTNVYQELPGALAHGAWSSPAYFNQTVYYAGQGDMLKAFPISHALLATTPSSHSTTTFAYPGSTPSVSANGTQDGIVWALESSSGTAVLHAYDATNLSLELYNSNQLLPGGGSSTFGNGNKFITPVVANGHVYIGTQNGVAVFGLLPN